MLPYWNLFTGQYSVSSIRPYFLELVKFALFCKEKFSKTVLEVKGMEILIYFRDVINKRGAKKPAKRRVRHIISGYYEYVKIYKKDIESKKFSNPVPSTKIFDFTGKSSSLDDLEQDTQLLSLEDVKRIIFHLYYTKESWKYIAGCLIIFAGPRVREVAQIQLTNLDVKNRWYITEVKSNISNKRMGIYFFPDWFIPDLNRYLNQLSIEHPGTKFLFPSSSSTGHRSVKTIQDTMSKIRKELGIEGPTNPHIFRDFVNSRREERGCNKPRRKVLLNQKTPDVNIKHYLKKYKNRVHLREIFDKFNIFDEGFHPNPQLKYNPKHIKKKG